MFGDNLERIVAAIEKNYEADEIFFTKPGRRFPSRTAIKGLITELRRVLSENHLKKVPVLESGHIVGIINRSDITQYSMAAYLADHPERAVYCGEGPSGQHECVEEACEER